MAAEDPFSLCESPPCCGVTLVPGLNDLQKSSKDIDVTWLGLKEEVTKTRADLLGALRTVVLIITVT
jgi:hypothetical protein